MAFRYSRKILGLYAEQSSKNCWVYVDGGFGWMRLNPNNFDAIQYMITELTHAKADNRFVDLDENPVGTISTIYVW